MPNLVSEDEREQATSLLTTVEHIAWTLGPILAGGLLAASGPRDRVLGERRDVRPLGR